MALVADYERFKLAACEDWLRATLRGSATRALCDAGVEPDADLIGILASAIRADASVGVDYTEGPEGKPFVRGPHGVHLDDHAAAQLARLAREWPCLRPRNL